MKKTTFTLTFLLFFVCGILPAQQSKSNFSYDRIALTVVYVDDPTPDEHMTTAIRNSAKNNYLKGIKIPDRYDDNAIPSKVISFDLSNSSYVMSDSVKLISAIYQANLTRQMVEKWFARKSDGQFSMDLIKERGLYNATDDDYLTSVASQRKNAALEDMGEKLIQKNYLLMINHSDIEPQKDSNGKVHYSGSARAYLYRLVWDEETGSNFYNNLWINDDDSEVVKKQKIDQFNNTTFKVKYVKSFRIDKSQSLTIGLDKMSDGEKIDHINAQFVEGIIEKLAGISSDFTVKKHLIASDPPAATIGSKEGLYVDQRFFVYETVMNRNKSTSEKRRSVIRVKKVSNNKRVTEGKTTPSVFYQVASGEIDHYGMYIQEKNDFGLSLSINKVSGGIGGVDFMAAYRVSRFIGFPGLQVYADLGFDKQAYNYSYYGYERDSHSFTRFSIGILKEYHLFKVFEASWKAGYGGESTELTGNKETEDQIDLSTQFFLLGGRLGMNVLHNVQLVSGVNLNMPFGKASLTVGDAESVDQEEGWTYYFEDRKGLNMFLGLKILF